MNKKELEIGGRTLSLETGAVARQANGACVIRYGDTVVLATACYKDGAVLGDFMPLTVDYKEYTYAGGRIPGGFFKREGRVGDTPLVGAGTYAEDGAGAASATGIGEAIIRVCLTKTTCEWLRQGMSPEAAARADLSS